MGRARGGMDSSSGVYIARVTSNYSVIRYNVTRGSRPSAVCGFVLADSGLGEVHWWPFFPAFLSPLTIESGQPSPKLVGCVSGASHTRCQMLTLAAATVVWIILVMLFFAAYAPQKTLAEVIRDVESTR
jgi:hypothetical protein